MKNKIITITFISFLIFFSVFHILKTDAIISTTERRTLAKFPNFEFNGEYISKIEKYLLDHFPYRDNFRSIKANFNYKILNRLDNNGIYLKDNYIFKSNYPTNEKSITNFINKTNKIKELLTKENKTFMMIIPDKNYYLEDENFLHIDYDYISNELEKIDTTFIDIKNTLNINDYYETDTHWKQENLLKVISKMNEHINFNYQQMEYKENKYKKFYGVYYGESAIKRKAETITYLTNEIIENAQVKYLENSKLNKVYNIDKLNDLDSYDVFLDGASAFIEINNPNITEDKELVIFRDSFGSSITPLLIPYYSKITLIDNRYISSDNFKNLIEFNNQDILFIYSALIVNTSNTLKG